MTFIEQYMNAMLGGQILGFKHIDTLLESFEVDIPEEYLRTFNSINEVIQYIFETALQAAQHQVGITAEYSIEANSLASYLAIKEDDGSWTTVYLYRDIVETLEAIQQHRLEED